MNEAEEKYPTNAMQVSAETAEANLEKSTELQRSLTKQYKARIREQRGLTKRELESIEQEGIENSWPRPELPSEQ